MSGPQPGTPHVRVHADLAIEVDGVPAHVSGHGDLVEVITDRPVALARSVASLSVPRVLDRSPRSVGGELARRGLRIEVKSPRGLVVAIGAPATAGAAGTGGQRRLEPGPARVVAAEVVYETGHVLSQRRGLVATVLVVLAVLGGVEIARRVLRRRY